MKKRILALLLIAAMTFTLLAACGSKNDGSADNTPDTEAQDPSFGCDLNEFYNNIMNAAGEAPAMMELTGEMLDGTYEGLSAVDTKQCVVYSPAIGAVAVEFAFVEVANSADVETVKAIFEKRIDNQIHGGAFYPATIEGWQNHSEIVVIDNFVCLFVCSEKDGMIEAFRSGTDVPAWGAAPEADVEGDVGIMDMPVEDGPAAFDPDYDVEVEDSVPAVETSTAPEAEQPVAQPIVSGQPKPEATPAPSAPAADGVDLETFYNDLYAKLYPMSAEGYSTGPFVEDFAAMPEMLDGFYPGLSAVGTKQLHVYMPAMTGVPYELVLVEVANNSDVETVKTILQTRIDTEKANQFAYPSVIENWELNSRIAVNGNFILMAVTSDCDAYVDAFNALF